MPFSTRTAAILLGFLTTASLAQAADAAGGISLSLDVDGLAIRTPAEGRLVLEYPSLSSAQQEQVRPEGVKASGKKAAMLYPNGARAEITLDGDDVSVHFTAIPSGVKGVRMDMTVPLAMKDGGRWRFEDGETGPFPKDFGGEQFVFKGGVQPVRLTTPGGAAFTLAMPHGWQQMQDNRKWNTDSFAYMTSADLPQTGGEAYYSFHVGTGAARPKPAPKAVAVKLSLRMDGEGLAIDAGGMGHFNLSYPVLVGDRWDKVHKPIEKRVSGNTAAVQFDGNTRVELALEAATGELTVTPANIPADVKSIRMEMLIDFRYADGGFWKIGGGAETAFPVEKPAKAFLYQGNADTLVLRDVQGATLTLQVPQHSYQQVTDNREWGWKIFGWQFSTNCQPGSGPFKVKLAVAAPTGGEASAGVKVTVDKFGQSVRADYPGKVKSEEELKADVRAEAEYLSGLHPPAWDTFGGLPGSREQLGLRKTGFFHLEQHGKRWLLVDPLGNAFFHLGVCVFNPGDDYTYVKGREGIYEWLPPYSGDFASAYRPQEGRDTVSFHLANTIRKYGKPYNSAEYTARMIQRVQKWGFNSIGAFSGVDAGARRKANFPYVSGLPLSTWEGFPELPGAHGVFDPFDEKLRKRCEENFAAHVAKQADDPLLIGCFLTNEPLYEDIPRAVAALDGKYACKQRLARMLEEKYKTIDAFNKSWGTSLASFADVAQRGLPTKSSAAQADMAEFTGLLLDAYFRLVADTFHKHDKNHLLIGNRLQPHTIDNEQLCRISGKYLDVMSFNYYTYALDKDLLNRIHGWTGGRPMMLSEFYYNSPRESGLPGGGKDVSSQKERGLGYRNYVEQAASLDYMVGIEWFTLVDQSYTGRFFEKLNGENANTGLISVADRPWRPMLDEMLKTNYDIYKVLLGQRPPFAYMEGKFKP
jgi:hypothetical protein